MLPPEDPDGPPPLPDDEPLCPLPLLPPPPNRLNADEELLEDVLLEALTSPVTTACPSVRPDVTSVVESFAMPIVTVTELVEPSELSTVTEYFPLFELMAVLGTVRTLEDSFTVITAVPLIPGSNRESVVGMLTTTLYVATPPLTVPTLPTDVTVPANTPSSRALKVTDTL